MKNSESQYSAYQQLIRVIMTQRVSEEARLQAVQSLLKQWPAEVIVAELASLVMEWQVHFETRFGSTADFTPSSDVQAPDFRAFPA